MFARNFGRQLEAFYRSADDFIVFGIFGFNFRSDFHVPSGSGGGDPDVELFAANKLAIGDFFRSITDDADDAVFYGQLVGRRA